MGVVRVLLIAQRAVFKLHKFSKEENGTVGKWLRIRLFEHKETTRE
jgi:hypothetical protein